MRRIITTVIALLLMVPWGMQAQTSIVSTSPSQNSEGVSVSSSIEVVFSDPIDYSTVSQATARLHGSVVGLYAFSTAYDGSTKTLTITPNTSFRYGEVLNFTLTSEIKDANGQPIGTYVLVFRTKYIGGAGTFTQSAVASVGNTPEGIGAIDLDGDRDLDFVVANHYSSSVTIFENTGNGMITQRGVITIGSEPQAVPMAMGDFDGDGDNDFAVPCRGSGYVSVFRNDGAWTYTVTNISIGGWPIGSTAGDIDGDGDLDLVFGNLSNIKIYLNDGTGVFSLLSTLSPSGSPHSPSLADIDADGDLDLVCARYNSISVVMYSNDGAGNYSYLSTYTTGSQPRTVEPADYDLDGDIDLAVANRSGNTVTILSNDGTGVFTQANISAGSLPHTASAIDLEGDGDLDLLISNGLFLVNDGSGTFSPSGSSSLHEYPVVGDIDGDGDADIARINNVSHVIRVLLNDGVAQPPSADAGLDVTYECTSLQGRDVLLDGSGSSDPNASTLTYAWYENGQEIVSPSQNSTALLSLPVGVHTLTLVVENGFDLTATDDVEITVVDNTAPEIAELDEIVAPTDPGVCYRSASNITLQVPTVTDLCSSNITVTNDAPQSYPHGTTAVTWTAMDEYGNSSTQTQLVTIYDNEPPQISATVSPSVLWPPDHKMVTINANVVVTDNCSAQYTLKSITSNEPDNGIGDGDTENDIQFGLNDDIFSLRAERSGIGSGRTYTVTYEATDGNQNVSTATAYVYVPHSAPKTDDGDIGSARAFRLEQNYPNPFTGSTAIRYSIPENGNVSLKVFNSLGEVVATLADGDISSGTHESIFQAEDLPAGLYLCRLVWSGKVENRRLVITR